MSLAPERRGEKWLWLLAVLVAWLAGTTLSLWDQDESAYAAFAWQMKNSGNWLIPEFLWSEIHRKPPFHFWSIAGSYSLWGVNEFAVRFPAFLALGGTVLLLRYRLAHTFGLANARLAAWILAANLFLPHLIKISVTDASLLFFETMATIALFNFFHQPSRKEQLFFVLGVAGALLVKGPPVLILTIGMLGLILLFSPERKKILAFHPWFLFPIAAIPLLIWGKMAWAQDQGAFIQWMIEWYTISRVSNEVLGQTGPPGYYLATILIAFLPFSLLLPKAFKSLFTHVSWRKPDLQSFLLLSWLIAGWLIYEGMKSKLPAYAISAYPAIAMLLARQFNKLQPRGFLNDWSLKTGVILYALLSLALAVALPMLATSVEGDIALFTAAGLPIGLFIGLGFLSITLLAMRAFFRSNFRWGFRYLLLQSIFFLTASWLLLLPNIEEKRSATRWIAQYVRSEHPHQSIGLSKDYQLPSLPFYLATEGIAYETTYKAEQWLEILKKGDKLLLFDSSNFPQLQQLAAETGIRYEIRAEKQGWISDRGKFTSWFIVRGAKAPTTEMESAAE